MLLGHLDNLTTAIQQLLVMHSDEGFEILCSTFFVWEGELNLLSTFQPRIDGFYLRLEIFDR